ncbi:MFS transporter [Rhodococcus qingshengii]|uniref:MFS transporter n=1 Tax=Rhodococcus qingshengii TaxID=334542 RepID=UPI001BEAE1A2|nr:MFS transporter [Rhodococcus qingshengii]MBT2270828.1 MFS transporter [Rhodococcus qingshengii]
MTAETDTPTTLSPKYRRHLVMVFALTNTISFIAMIQILPVVLIPITTDLDVSRTAVAGASTISTLVGGLAALPIGRILDRRGGRLLMATGSLIGAGSVLLWSQATNLVSLYAAFALIGLALAMSTYESTFAVIVVATESHQRNQAILTVTMIAGLSTYLVYPLLGWMNSEFGWRTTLIILSAILVATAVPGHLWAVPSRAAHRNRVRTRSGTPFGAALRQRRFWLLLIAFVAQAGSASAFLLLVIAYLLDQGHSVAVSTSAPIAVGVLQILSRLILTVAGTRLAITPVTLCAFAIQGFGLLLLPLAGLSIPLTLLCVAAVGLGQGVGVIARPSILADNFGVTHFASVLAAMIIPTALARAGSPLLGAWLADWRFLMVCGVLALVAAVALLPLLEFKSRDNTRRNNT